MNVSSLLGRVIERGSTIKSFSSVSSVGRKRANSIGKNMGKHPVTYPGRTTAIPTTAMTIIISAALSMALALGAITGSALLPGSEAEAQNAVAYRLSPGDQVRVTVFGHEDLSGEFEVDPEGRLSLPLIQYVDAQGATSQELEGSITSSLSPDYLKNPRVTVEILNYRPFYILGEVESPGSYDYVSGMTVLESVAVAGGFTYRAKQKKMTIVRASDPEKKKMPASVDTRILPGDVVEVPERRW